MHASLEMAVELLDVVLLVEDGGEVLVLRGGDGEARVVRDVRAWGADGATAQIQREVDYPHLAIQVLFLM
jgi:hypothetical protein